jgi:hypothetical protein
MGTSGVGVAVGLGAMGALATPRGATTTPLEQRWAWSAIAKSDVVGSRQDPKTKDQVVVTVVDGGRKRTLHFRPAAGPGALYAAIEAQRG